MKKYISNILLMLFSIFLSSCLDGNLEELPEYDDADITSVSTVQYRYITDEKHPASGENVVKEVELHYNADIDAVNRTVKIDVSVPIEVSEDISKNISKKNLLVAVSISTAARLFPVGNSPKLGVPGDWTKTNIYTIMSASGIKKDWKIEIVSLKK